MVGWDPVRQAELPKGRGGGDLAMLRPVCDWCFTKRVIATVNTDHATRRGSDSAQLRFQRCKMLCLMREK